METNKIYCENCLETMSRMPDNFVDLVVTSPPYDNLRNYNGYSFDFESIAKELFRVVKIGGVVVWVVGDATINGSETGTSFRQALFFMQCGFNLHDTMIYKKIGVGSSGSNLGYPQSFEYMFVFSKKHVKTINHIKDIENKEAGDLRRYAKTKSDKDGYKSVMVTKEIALNTKRDNVWFYNIGFSNSSDKTNHPAVFPEQLCADHIHSWSNENDLVYDPFMGSGTTAKMAHLQKRNWIGSEISQEFHELANKRIDPYLKQLTIF